MRYVGRSTGMSLNQYFSFLFKLNDKIEDKFTDETIIKKVKDEFKHYPEMLAKLTLQDISNFRSLYNTGFLRKGYVPQTPSFRYREDGTILSPQGNPLSKERIKAKLLKHKERINIANKED